MLIENSASKVSDYQLDIKRNFRGTPFSPLMTKEAKLQVERKVVEVLGDLYGTYTQINKLSDADCDWMLKTIGIHPKIKNREHDASGINDDWPVGRGVFIQDKKDFLVFVNFEDHLRIVVLPDKTSDSDGLNQGIKRGIKLLQTFEKLGYATDPYLGNLTVSPANLGTAMTMKCNLTLRGNPSAQVDNQLIQQLKLDQCIKYEREDDVTHTLVTQKTLA